MRAAVYETYQGPIAIQNVAEPPPKIYGVVVKVGATGLCLSDWHGWMGHDPDIVLPHVPGHELAGTIEAIGKNVRNFKMGDRVTVPFVSGCGNCYQCHFGNHQVCDHQSQPGFSHWGSFAEIVALDYADTNLVKILEELSDITAANLRKGGKHIQVGLMTGNHQHAKVPMDKVLANELENIGSHGLQAYKYPDMLNMIKNGKIQPEKLTEKTISQEEAMVDENGSFIWGFSVEHVGQVRYTIKFEDGKWVESGEMNRDGNTWFPFFGMTLTKD